MIKFDKPLKIDGEQLIVELNDAGIQVKNSPLIDGNGDFWLDIDSKDKSKAEPIVAIHVAKDKTKEQQLAKQAILDRLGITADELKTILG